MAAIPHQTERASALAALLVEAVPHASPLRIRVLSDAQSFVETQPDHADLYLRPGAIDVHGGETVDLLVVDTHAPRLLVSGVPWNGLQQRLVRLAKTYQVERCGRDTFRTWAGGLSERDLRVRLGLENKASSS